MKLLRRIGVVAFLAVLGMTWAGSVWADVSSVRQAIEGYDLNATVLRITVMVGGSVGKSASDVFILEHKQACHGLENRIRSSPLGENQKKR
jgi:hypothetical protein